MYPTFYHLVEDLFGIRFEPFLLMQSYGMMVALGFIVGSFILTSELKRKEANGQMPPLRKKVWKGVPSTAWDKAMYALVGFILGFKLLFVFTDLQEVARQPQLFILSATGSWLGGILGAAAGLALRRWEDRKDRLKTPVQEEVVVHPHEHIGNIVMLTAFGGILGAKLFHNLENWDQMMADPIGALTSFSGLSFFGGMVCATALNVWYARKNALNIIHLLDAAIPAVALGYGFGRLGCHVSGDGDWGIPNDRPMPEWLSFLPEWMWRYDYPNNILGVDMVDYFASKGYVSETGYAYPTPIYEIIMSVILFIFLWMKRKEWTTPGLMTAWYLLLGAGVERLLIEQIRINNEYDIFGFGITQAELLSTGFIILGSIGILRLRK